MCAKLEFLDIRGCWHVDMSETFAKEASQRLKVFHAPIVIDDIYDDESFAYLSEYEDYANEPESCSYDNMALILTDLIVIGTWRLE